MVWLNVAGVRRRAGRRFAYAGVWAGMGLVARPDRGTMFGDLKSRSAFRVSTIGTPLSTIGFQSKAEWSVQMTQQST